MLIRIVPAVVMAFLLCACQAPATDSVASGDADSAQVVARYQGHEISVADVDARVLALPRSERPKPGEDLDSWFEQQAREIAMDELLRAEALEAGVIDEPEYLIARNDFETRAGVQLCIAALHPDIEQMEPAEIEAAYEARREEFSQPERRSVLYIFKRPAADKSEEAALAEVEALRMRVLGGESFAQLATENSDSETRHKGGSLDWLTTGELPASLDEVVFGLEEGVPSDALVTPEGVHLFYVQKILPARTLSLKEVRKKLRSRLLAERRMQALNELETDTEMPPDSLVLDRKSFDEAMRAGDPKIPVLRIDGRQLEVGGLRILLAQANAQNKDVKSPIAAGNAWNHYQAIRRLSLAFHQCKARGLVPAEVLASQIGAWEDKAMLQLIRQRRLLELAGSDEQKMRAFYESNIGQFSTPPKWRLRHLSIPIGPDAVKVMAELETAAASDATDSNALAARFGGTTEDWEPADLSALSRRDARLVRLVSPLAVGQLSAPLRSGDALELVEVLEREESSSQPFDQVRAQVVTTYVDQYTSDVYQQLAAGMLAESGFEVAQQGLANLRALALPQVEVTVEELESMIEQL